MFCTRPAFHRSTHRPTTAAGNIATGPSSSIAPLEYRQMLEVMLCSAESRTKLVALAKERECSEIFLFLAAIIDWERITNAKERKAKSLKLVSLFVEMGGAYASFMPLTEDVRDELLARKRIGDAKFFAAAKAELVTWVYAESKITIAVT